MIYPVRTIPGDSSTRLVLANFTARYLNEAAQHLLAGHSPPLSPTISTPPQNFSDTGILQRLLARFVDERLLSQSK